MPKEYTPLTGIPQRGRGKRNIITDVSDFAKDGEPYAFRLKAPNGLVAYFQDTPEEGIVSFDPDALIWHEEPNALQ